MNGTFPNSVEACTLEACPAASSIVCYTIVRVHKATGQGPDVVKQGPTDHLRIAGAPLWCFGVALGTASTPEGNRAVKVIQI